MTSFFYKIVFFSVLDLCVLPVYPFTFAKGFVMGALPLASSYRHRHDTDMSRSVTKIVVVSNVTYRPGLINVRESIPTDIVTVAVSCRYPYRIMWMCLNFSIFWCLPAIERALLIIRLAFRIVIVYYNAWNFSNFVNGKYLWNNKKY